MGRFHTIEYFNQNSGYYGASCWCSISDFLDWNGIDNNEVTRDHVADFLDSVGSCTLFDQYGKPVKIFAGS